MTETYPPPPEQSRRQENTAQENTAQDSGPQENTTQQRRTQEGRTQERTQEAVRANVGSTFIIRAQASSVRGHNADAFWNDFHSYIGPRDQQPSIDRLEDQVRRGFASSLQGRFERFLGSYPSANYEPEVKRRIAREMIKFSVSHIGYGSIDITTVIEHLDGVVDAFGLTLDTVTAILSANAPGALNDALGVNLSWDVTVQPPNIQGPPQQATEPQAATERQRASGLFARFSGEAFMWKLLNALYIVPIIIALFVLISTYREMNERIASYDRDLLKVKTDEIARTAARSDRFDEQYVSLLQRHEAALKENADAIRGVLSDELKRVAARLDYFDQQQVLLLQRYENISKESYETIKALAQKPDSKPVKDSSQKSDDSIKATAR
jgi:hypothetical protein